jgi:hypothetical protein
MLSTLHFLSILNNKAHVYLYVLLDQNMVSQYCKIYLLYIFNFLYRDANMENTSHIYCSKRKDLKSLKIIICDP